MTIVTILTRLESTLRPRDVQRDASRVTDCFDRAGMLPSEPVYSMDALFMHSLSVRTFHGILAIVASALTMACQIAPPLTEGYPLQESLKRKSKEEILVCAGTPLREWQDGEFTLLRYYREAPLLEESMVSSKSSRPTAHHGCWATVTIQHDQVEQIHYRFVPNSVDASNDCEEIFVRCQE